MYFMQMIVSFIRVFVSSYIRNIQKFNDSISLMIDQSSDSLIVVVFFFSISLFNATQSIDIKCLLWLQSFEKILTNTIRLLRIINHLQIKMLFNYFFFVFLFAIHNYNDIHLMILAICNFKTVASIVEFQKKRKSELKPSK